MHYRENSWSFAAITVLGSIAAMLFAAILLACIFGAESRISFFGAIVAGAIASPLIRARLSRGTWRIFKRPDHF